MMRPQPRKVALVAIVSFLTVGCTKTATVEGDLSLGATKGAFQKVALVRNPADSLLRAIDELCRAEQADIKRQTDQIQVFQAGAERFRRVRGGTMSAQVAISDSVSKYRRAALDADRMLRERPDTTFQRIQALMKAATDTQVDTDMEGHFEFPKRKPGNYVLFVEWIAAKGDNHFVASVDASGGGKRTQNLDQSTVSTKLRCR